MTFISYAQNFEDVILWRALKHIQKGFYVDVGANDPIYDSVTMAFYQRGWHGINIEPVHKCFVRLCEERVHDINLEIAAGSQPGQFVMYEMADSGLSTFDLQIAQGQSENGHAYIEQVVTVSTLNEILATHANSDIHFLKVDVEGFEKEVLSGLDLSQWRPWILVIEANKPNSSEDTSAPWDKILRDSDYIFAQYDGLNKFFVAQEHRELIPSLQIPPNFFDNYKTRHQDELEKFVKYQDSAFTEKATLLQAASANLHTADQKITDLQSKMDQLIFDHLEANRVIVQSQTQINKFTSQLSDLQLEVVRLKESNYDLTYSKKLQEERASNQAAALNQQLDTANLQIIQQASQAAVLNQQLDAANLQITQQASQAAVLNQQLDAANLQITEQASQVAALNAQLDAANLQITEQASQVAARNLQLDVANLQTTQQALQSAALSQQLDAAHKLITQLRLDFAEKAEHLRHKEIELGAIQQYTHGLHGEFVQLQNYSLELQGEFSRLQRHIESVTTQLIFTQNELNVVYRSFSIRVTAPLRWINKSFQRGFKFREIHVESVFLRIFLALRKIPFYVFFKNLLRQRYPQIWLVLRKVLLPSYSATASLIISTPHSNNQPQGLYQSSVKHYETFFATEIEALKKSKGKQQ